MITKRNDDKNETIIVPETDFDSVIVKFLEDNPKIFSQLSDFIVFYMYSKNRSVL